jgi:serine protease Do
MIRKLAYSALIAIGLGAFLTPSAYGQFHRPEKPDAYLRGNTAVTSLFKPVIEQAAKSTVKLLSDGKEVCYGTVVGADGWVVTNDSELRGNKLLVKFKDGRELEPKIVGVEDRYDLAMLKIPATGLVAADWRNSKSATLGKFVATPGVSGNPVAIGVVGVATKSMKMSDYPVPHRNKNSGWLGVGLDDTSGLTKIRSVAKDSAAAKAGLKEKDVVISVAGKKISDSETMIFYLMRYKIGENVALKIKRGDEEMEIKATLGKRPAEFGFPGIDRGQFQNGIHKDLSDVNVGFPVALQHDTVLKSREVGGPLVDLDGKVIGINIASSGRVDSYAIPSEVIQGLLPELMSGKLAPCIEEPKKEEKKDDKKTSTQTSNK